MAGASDYMVGRDPDIAHAGNYADMLMRGLSNVGESYQKGQDFRYKQRQQDLFQDPDSQAMLEDALKTGNYAPVLQKMIRAQGAGAAPVIGQLMSDQAGARLADSISGGGGAQPSTAPNYSPTGQTEAALTKASARVNGGGPSNPRIPYGGDEGYNTRTLTAQIGGENGNASEDVMRRFAQRAGLGGADEDLTPEQVANLRPIIGGYFKRTGSSQSAPPATNDAASGGPPPINAASANQGNESPSVGGGGGPAISPAPTAAAGAIQPSGPQVAQNATRDTLSAADRGIRPSPVGTEAQAREAETKAQRMRALQAYYAGRNPKAAEAIGARAAEEEKRAHEIRDSIGKYNEPGRIQRDVESGAARQQELDKSDIVRFGKQYDQVQHQADETNKLLDTLKLTKGLMDQPSFYSGAGSDFVLSAKRIGVALGLTNPSEAQAMEAFGKTVSSAVLDQIRSLGGQGLGQVRVAEIKVMQAAAQNHDNTPASNRLLTELQERMGEKWTLPIAKLAREYNNGHLDAGFDKVKQDWINKHPLLSKEELDDPRRIAPPLARTPADLAKIGWKDGMPFRTPDGRVLTHAPQAGG